MKFKIELYLTETDKQVKLPVEADSWDSANSLAEALAELMPSEEVYFDKSDETREVYWSSTVWDEGDKEFGENQ